MDLSVRITFVVAIACSLWASPELAPAQRQLDYQERSYAFEGIKPQPVSGFDLELIGQSPPPHPELRLVQSEREKWLVWRQVSFTLQSAESLSGPWQAEPGARSPFAITASGRSRFYRLALP